MQTKKQFNHGRDAMTTEQTGHTPGAMRAAQRVLFIIPTPSIATEDIVKVARIIDEETHAPEMLIALKGIIAALSQEQVFPADIAAAKSFARDALTAATGEK